MTSDFWARHVAAMADHFAVICAVPECKEQYWRRVKALADKEPWIYGGLPGRVAQLVKERQNA